MSRQGEPREERIKRIKRRIGILKNQIEFFNTELVKQSAATKIQALVRKKQAKAAKARKKSKGATGKEKLKKTLALLENRLSKQEQELEEAQKKDPSSAPPSSVPGAAKESATVVRGPLPGSKEKNAMTEIKQNSDFYATEGRKRERISGSEVNLEQAANVLCQNIDFYAAPFSANLGKHLQAFSKEYVKSENVNGQSTYQDFNDELISRLSNSMPVWVDLLIGDNQWDKKFSVASAHSKRRGQPQTEKEHKSERKQNVREWRDLTHSREFFDPQVFTIDTVRSELLESGEAGKEALNLFVEGLRRVESKENKQNKQKIKAERLELLKSIVENNNAGFIKAWKAGPVMQCLQAVRGAAEGGKKICFGAGGLR